jgi:hypothetical protein
MDARLHSFTASDFKDPPGLQKWKISELCMVAPHQFEGRMDEANIPTSTVAYLKSFGFAG